MKVADRICEKARELPEPLAKQVLEFMERINALQDAGVEELKRAQVPIMERIWDNKEDDIWNEL